MQLIIWLSCYALPTGIGVYLSSKKTSLKKELSLIHFFVAISIVLLSICGTKLNWIPSDIFVLFLGTSILISIYLIKFLGIVYTFSSILQETCLLLASVAVVSATGLTLGAIITSLVYTFAHFSHKVDWNQGYWKIPLLLSWGVVSIFLYSYFYQPLLNIGIHTLVGSILIRKGLLYMS